MSLDDFLDMSEEQTELLEELQKLINELEEAPADELMKERILLILRRLRKIREKMKDLAREEPKGDIALLQEFYRLVGVHDEKEILEELLKQIIRGRIDIPQDEVIADIKEMKELANEFKKEGDE